MKFPRHIGLDLEHNPHALVYETVERYLAHDEDGDDFVSDAERARAIATGELWELRWYPETASGFCRARASTLEALLAAVDGS